MSRKESDSPRKCHHYSDTLLADRVGSSIRDARAAFGPNCQNICDERHCKSRRKDAACALGVVGGLDMASDFGRPPASMEGRGSYNRHSLIPSGGGALALPHLERAIAEVALESIDQPVVIADYGSSQGLNSLGPMRLTVEAVRSRSSKERPILVDTSPERYSLNDPYVFPCAIGRSF
jgi:hypothetical protein